MTRLPKIFEVAPPRASHVHHRRHARAEAEPVGQHTVVAGPRVPHSRRGKEVHVAVDQSRGDVQAGYVDHRAGFRGIDAGSHGSNLSGGDRDVHYRIDVVARVDDVSSLEQDFVTRLSVDGRDHDNKEEQRKRESDERVQHALIVLETAACAVCHALRSPYYRVDLPQPAVWMSAGQARKSELRHPVRLPSKATRAHPMRHSLNLTTSSRLIR